MRADSAIDESGRISRKIENLVENLAKKNVFWAHFRPKSNFPEFWGIPTHLGRFYAKKRTKGNYEYIGKTPEKLLCRARIGPKNFFSAKFLDNIPIFHEIRPDSSIVLSARIVFKISGKFNIICHFFCFSTNSKTMILPENNSFKWII